MSTNNPLSDALYFGHADGALTTKMWLGKGSVETAYTQGQMRLLLNLSLLLHKHIIVVLRMQGNSASSAAGPPARWDWWCLLTLLRLGGCCGRHRMEHPQLGRA